MFKRYLVAVFLVFILTACSQSTPAAPAPPAETATPAATATPIPAPAAGVLQVEPDASWGPISPYVLGTNHGPWVAVPVDMLPDAYDSGIQAIRFPGGAWGDRNDLKSYHIDPFIAMCEEIGAMPTISVRLRQATPEQAAELVRYVNIEKEYGVEYWSIGNEPTLFAAELSQLGVADDYETEQYVAEWREFALAMKAVDPTIKLMGPEVHQYSHLEAVRPLDSAGRDWMEAFLTANGDLVDVVTFHRYPFPRGRDGDVVTVADLRAQSQEWSQTMDYLQALILEITGREIPIAITEVSTHYNSAIGGEATPDSHYAGIWLAEMVGQLMAEDIFMINQWMLASSGGQGGWGLIGRGELRPTYWVYQLYRQFGSEMVHAASGVDGVSVYAARRDDGTLTVIVVNLLDDPQSAQLQVAGAVPAGGELWQLTPDVNPETAQALDLGSDGALTLPGQSVSLLVFGP